MVSRGMWHGGKVMMCGNVRDKIVKNLGTEIPAQHNYHYCIVLILYICVVGMW